MKLVVGTKTIEVDVDDSGSESVLTITDAGYSHGSQSLSINLSRIETRVLATGLNEQARTLTKPKEEGSDRIPGDD